ncbi:acyloxyacyl hydrolase [Altererythrobacter sp. GH1-8]|uniref:acyloxyacyl hydrolase n=1 Tax=Altererythrobacter sp. GH1-8 TaxID=3349333 RepID=UPI00374D9275
MRQIPAIVASILGGVLFILPARANEVFIGVYDQGVDTPFSLDVADQGGVAMQLGYRFDPIETVLDIEPYLIASINTVGDASFAGIGISRRFDLGPVYLRPGVGFVIQDQSGEQLDPITQDRIDLGSQVLFEPEIALGTDLSEQVSLEASWSHISHARLFNSEQNPGVDLIGIRLNLKL